MTFNLKNILIAGSFVFAGLLAGCQVPTSKDAKPTNQSLSTLPAEFSVSSADWIDPKQEDAIASTAKVSGIAPDVYKMVFTIDEAALDESVFGYNRSNLNLFLLCMGEYVARRDGKSYLRLGEKRDGPNQDGRLPPSPYIVYMGTSNTPKGDELEKHSEIAWLDSGDGAFKAVELLPMCQNVFKRYPK